MNKLKIGLDFANMFKENKTLIHVDLSHNNFKKADCMIIDEGLKENHTIFGIHMLGNDINTNS
jgi:tRNA A-37 threonylcarbamoyl transferase component Bud32